MSGVVIVQLQNDMAAQRRATEFALRKRTHSEEQSRHELEWQLKIVSENFSSFAHFFTGFGCSCFWTKGRKTISFRPKIASYFAKTGW